MLAALAVLSWSPGALAAPFNHHRAAARERVLRTPVSPKSGSSNWIYRAYTVAAGTTSIQLEYDYLCSGAAVSCVSEYATAGPSGPWTVMQSISTGHNSGHFVTSLLPTTYPTLWVRFRYTKGSTVGYQDQMWVDDIRFQSNKTVEVERFPAHEPLTGWTAGGDNGGTGLVKDRLPVARAAGPSDNLGANTTINMERSIYFAGAAGNHCAVTYATDTAPTHKFRVYEGTTILLEKSGQSYGTEAVVLSNGAGNKTLKLSVSKDSAAPEGRDLVRVKGITCYTADTVVVGHWDFDGQAVGSTPYPPWITTCSGTCSGVGWRVRRATPHESYVPVQAFGAEPFDLDGLPDEYKKQGNATRALQFDWGYPENHEASLDLFSDGASLYLYWQVNAVTPGVVGNESGYIYVYLDDARELTLKRTSACGGSISYAFPSDDDRYINFPYSLATGLGEAAISSGSIVQKKGACDGTWSALGGGDTPVNVSAYVLDTGKDSIAFEMKIDLFGDMTADESLGVGLWRFAPTLRGFREHLPFHDYGTVPPLASDVYSWETVRLTGLPGNEVLPTERVDGCCFARREFL